MTQEPHETDAEIRRVCSILERVAANYSPDSDEATAIADAASAFIFVRQREALLASWQQLKSAHNGVLPDDVLERMRGIGIDINELESLE